MMVKESILSKMMPSPVSMVQAILSKESGYIMAMEHEGYITETKNAEPPGSSMGISLIGKDNRFKYLNPKFTEMFGYTLEDIPTVIEWAKKAFPEPNYRRCVTTTWLHNIQSTISGTELLRTLTVACKDGSEKQVRFRLLTLETGDKLLIQEDANATSFRNPQLFETQLMESMSTLAGGIAHQFNNALSSIIGNIELLETNHEDTQLLPECIKHMKNSANRMAHLTSQMLAYATGGIYRPKIMSLKNFIFDTLPRIWSSFNSSACMDTNMAQDLADVEVDPAQLQTVLSTILGNALEAMGKEGHIRISAKNVPINEAHIKNSPALMGGTYVCLMVEDNGCGMDEATRCRIFEPFFTTKFPGRGLSMAAAYGIIKKHNGWISVDSKLHEGTIIKIYLPAVDPTENNGRTGE